MNRRVFSIKKELISKSREAALSAVQIFNNPNILFKSEIYIVIINIAWTYLMHAFYRDKGIEYRYFTMHGKQKRYDKTTHGAYKHWVLETCLNKNECPLDNNTKNNLRFLIGLRHEIEHKMTSRIDDALSARFQACCINYNHYLKTFFGNEYGIDKHLSFSLQFSSISVEQKEMLSHYKNLPKNILSFINTFDTGLTTEEYHSPQYAYRMLFIPKTANRKGQADRVIEFVKSDSELASRINKEYVVIKEKDKKKYIPSQIVSLMKNEGYTQFSIHSHTLLWQEKNAKNPEKGYGKIVAGKYWYWYENWVEVVRLYCKNRYK